MSVPMGKLTDIVQITPVYGIIYVKALFVQYVDLRDISLFAAGSSTDF
jgi:hypothetical protein